MSKTNTTKRHYDMIIPGITIKLNGWFPDYYNERKPKNMSDEDFVNQVVLCFLMEEHDKLTKGDKGN